MISYFLLTKIRTKKNAVSFNAELRVALLDDYNIKKFFNKEKQIGNKNLIFNFDLIIFNLLSFRY